MTKLLSVPTWLRTEKEGVFPPGYALRKKEPTSNSAHKLGYVQAAALKLLTTTLKTVYICMRLSAYVFVASVGDMPPISVSKQTLNKDYPLPFPQSNTFNFHLLCFHCASPIS
jgi:hypothetical protein